MGKVLTRTMAAAAGAAMLLPLAACGGSADAGKTTISFLSWDNEQIMKPFIDEFEKENPDIKVDFGYAPPTNEYIQTLQTRLVGNQAPDVFVITSENKNDLIDNGYALDMTGKSYVKKLSRRRTRISCHATANCTDSPFPRGPPASPITRICSARSATIPCRPRGTSSSTCAANSRTRASPHISNRSEMATIVSRTPSWARSMPRMAWM